MVADFIGKPGSGAAAFLEFGSVIFEDHVGLVFIEMRIGNFSPLELNAHTFVFNEVNSIRVTPVTALSGSANCHAFPLVAVGGISAFSILNRDTVRSSFRSESFNFICGTMSIIASTMVHGMDIIEVDNFRAIDSIF